MISPSDHSSNSRIPNSLTKAISSQVSGQQGKTHWSARPYQPQGPAGYFRRHPHRVSIVSDGTLQPWPDDWDDDGFAAKLEAGILQEASIDALVAEMIEDSRNEPDIGADGVLSDFHGFLDRLKRATRFLEDEIKRRVARALDAGDRLVNQNEQPQIKAPGDEPEHG